jgi:acetylornithine deacetylase/succinyl-diaminopimelate desuccinylase-like protein
MWTMPDAEQLFIDYLEPVLGVPVGVEAAEAAPFVRVTRSGGVKVTPVSDGARMTFDCYHIRGSLAWALAEEARVAVHALAGTTPAGLSVNIKDVTEEQGPANDPDPTFPALVRYSFTVTVHVRGTP